MHESAFGKDWEHTRMNGARGNDVQGRAASAAGPAIGSRATRQKRAVAAALAGTERFTSAQDLHLRLRANGDRIGLTTVYNQLRALAAAGEIDAVRGDDGEIRYRRCASTTHHHHLTCRHCGDTVEIDLPETETRAEELATQAGYSAPTHTVEVFGTCPTCQTLTPTEGL